MYYIAATTSRLLLWKDRYNKDLLDNNKINIQAKCYIKSIKSPIGSILDKNKKKILYGNIKFKIDRKSVV